MSQTFQTTPGNVVVARSGTRYTADPSGVLSNIANSDITSILNAGCAPIVSGGGGGSVSTVVLVTSGTTSTISNANTTVSWKSPAAAAKAQTIPGASAANAGQDIIIVDAYGNAGLYPIYITPASGTIMNGALASVSSNNNSLTLRSDGVSNWMVI